MTLPDTSSHISTYHLRRRTPGTFVLVPCQRLGRSIRCQGQLEAAAARVLAACPLVSTIQEQPFSIWYAWREQDPQITLLNEPPSKKVRRTLKCSYIVPDFLVTRQNGQRCLLEIKPSSRLHKTLVQRKLAVARKFAEAHGQTFHVITERELFAVPLLANVRLLGRFALLSSQPNYQAAIEAELKQHPLTLANLVEHFASRERPAHLKAAILHLVATGRIDFDPCAALLSDQTLLYPGGTLPWDPFDSVWAPSGSSTVGTSGSSAS
jgi:hypothetical protein